MCQGWVKPLDKKLVGMLASDHRAVITIEAGFICGPMFSAFSSSIYLQKNLQLRIVTPKTIKPKRTKEFHHFQPLFPLGERNWRFWIPSAAGKVESNSMHFDENCVAWVPVIFFPFRFCWMVDTLMAWAKLLWPCEAWSYQLVPQNLWSRVFFFFFFFFISRCHAMPDLFALH